MKTDKAVIADLPDKTEVKAFCGLSRKQAALYEQAVAGARRSAGGQPTASQRKGVVLAMLMRLKQICNHPSQWLGDGAWAEADSGKFARLREIAEVVGGAAGEDAGLHPVPRDDRAAGGVPRRRLRPARAGAARRDGGARSARTWCSTFQEDETVPFFVLSLKAGGVGAEPDRGLARRAFRSLVEPGGGEPGDRPRLPHRPEAAMCWCTSSSAAARSRRRSTRLIESKQGLSDELLAGGGEINLTEMKDDELLRLVALDLNAAMRD